ncbi:glycine--tRNA ligase subunit beta [Hazenella coriacea]|uniref:Glycine--tRNA ligase beta subunit n=1 Tax=Hazenella coriacea TaxID=1179467 RepID=A0A4R3L5S6_9BACL|nr:glycine--tRNA ligase subunit beta [Hazenella coriacea]TCS94752.1 glycyl-tRNA synthetase beta chain [Hazenella coriacea]
MSKKDFLLEMGCEEIPARFVTDAIQQLASKIEEWLIHERIEYGEIRTFATPRRLTVFVQDVADHQADFEDEVKGPAARIAKTADGDWSKAAEGFARKQGVSTEQLVLKELKGVQYVFAKIHQPGAKTVDQLNKEIHKVFQGLHFPKTMRWGTNKTRFIRPVRWIVCLYGKEVLPVEWAGVTAGNLSKGHRFLGSDVMIPEPSKYIEIMREQFVIADATERRELILNQLKELEQENHWSIPVDEELLEEITYLVEYPTALSGSFEKEYLLLPKSVLITTMKEHQRYFSVENEQGELLPYFVTVRNGNDHGLELVAKGNEKVLRARLADARFFFEEDLKLPIQDAVEKLDSIVFQEELGSIGDRSRRVQKLAMMIAQQVGLDEENLTHLQRAAEINKFSLATQIVNEFPELEGIMGQIYALHAKEASQVANAILEYQYPRIHGDEIPKSMIGSVLSIADKMDSITSSFGIGIQPTGSQDPYGLRRRAAAIVQVLLQENRFTLSLSDLIQHSLNQLESDGLLKEERETVENDLEHFFALRIKAVLQEEQIRYDVIDAVLAAGINHPVSILEKAKVLMGQLEREAFKHEVEGFTRTANLAEKASEVELSPSGLLEPSEQSLYKSYQEAKTDYLVAFEQQNSAAMYQALVHMVPEIHSFFDHVMVMVEDEQVRQNRLALLKEITNLVKRFASFEHLVFPS